MVCGSCHPQSPQIALNPSPYDSLGPAVLKYSCPVLPCCGLSSFPGIVRKALSYRSSLDFLACAHFQGSVLVHCSQDLGQTLLSPRRMGITQGLC